MTATFNGDTADVADAGNGGGSSGNVFYGVGATATSVQVSFSSPVNISSLVYFEADGTASTGNYTFTVTSGSGSTIVKTQADFTLLSGLAGVTLTPVDWTSVSTFTITSDAINFAPGLDTLVYTMGNNTPVLTNLNGDSVTWAGVGNYVSLDAGTSLGVSDTELDALNGGNGNYAGATLTLQRVGAAITTDVFGFDTSGALFSVSGANLQSGGLTFATFTNASGVLNINFNSSATTATKSLVQDVLQRIQYSNNTPAADAALRYSLSDGTASTTADVTVTSDSVYVTSTTDTATININDGVSFSEAVAIALADTTGSQTLILSSAFTSSMSLAGNLSIAENMAIDASAAGSSFVIAGSTLTLGSGVTLSLTHANQLQISSTINGAGNLSKAGAGTLRLTGTNSSRTGSTSVLGGTLDIDADTNLDGANTGVLTLNGGTLAMTVTGGSTGNPVIQTINNPITLGASGGSFNPTGGGGRNIINLSGVISGSGNLTKIGASVLQLSGNNSYSGQTLITNGGLILSHNNGLGSTSGSTTVNAGSALRIAAGVVSPEPLFLNGTGRNIDAVDYGALGADAYSLGTSTVSGNIALSTDTNISVTGGSNLIVSGSVSGTGTLTKTDTGSLTLAGTNTNSGATSVSAGTLVLDNGAAIADSTAVSIASGATLRLDASETIGVLSGAGTLAMNGAHLTVNQTSDSSFAGNITGSGSNLTKSGSSKLTLSGTNTYTGVTSISGGSLNLTGALSGTTGATIGSGGTLEGSGSLFATSSANTLTVQSGGILSPGISGPGTITINGNLTIAAGGALTTQITGTVLGSGYDSVAVNGTVDVSAATLNVSHSYTAGLGDSYRLLVNDGVDSITGSFSGLPQGGTVTASGNSTVLTAYYAATDGGAYSGGNEFMLVAPVDSTPPTVSSVTVPANATYVSGQVLDFLINFDENVTVNTAGGTPQLALTIGATIRQATYQSGSGSSSLLYRYTIQSGDADSDGIAIGALASNGGTLRDATGNNANLTLNSVGSTASVLVDAVAPIVSSVNVPANSTYVSGQNLDFSINFDENITVNTGGGTPQLSLIIGATARQAVYQSGSGSSSLLYRYTIQSGDADSDGIAIGTLASNGGTLRDAAGNNANLTLNAVGSTASVLVDAIAPSVSSVNVPANSTYVSGQNFDFAINFDENITVNTGGGTPQLALTVGAITRQAVYLSGSGTSSLLYRYTVQNGDDDSDGIAIGSLASNGGTLRDAAGNNANLTLNAVGSTASVLVDAVAPSVSSVNVPANSTYVSGQNLDFAINFDENITVNTGGGTPQLALTLGATTRQAVYLSGSGTSSLLYRYTIQSGDADSDGIAIGSLASNGGTLRDSAGNNANLTLNSVGSTASVLVDAAVPVVAGVTSSNADGSYKAGDVIVLQLSFNETVTVTGSPQLTLETGVTDRTVNYGSGSGSSTLVFNYIVQAGDGSGDLDYTAVNALMLNGGSIKDSAGNAASLILSLPGTTGSLSANKALIIDTSAPTVPAAPDLIAASDTGNSDTDNITDITTPTFSGTAEASSIITVLIDNISNGTTTADGSGNWTYIATVLTAGSHTVAATATDAAGNVSESSANLNIQIGFNAPAAPAAVNATAGDAQASVSFSAPVNNGGAVITSYTATSSPGGLTASGAASPLTVTGLTNGTAYTFSVTATNSANTSVASVASNSVTPVAPNSAPTINGTPATTIAQDTAYSFVPTATDVDAETTLTFSIVNKPTWASFNTATGALTGTPANDDIGVTNAIVISVTDGSLSAALPAFNLSVTNTNDAPTISGAPDVTVAQDSAYTFTPTATDVDADTTLTFSIANKPSWASFNTATGALSGTPTNDDIGVTNAIVISVSDGSLSAALPAFNLSVTNTNDAPTISGAPAVTVAQDAAYSFVPTAADVDADTTLTFSIVNKPSWASFNTTTGALTGTPTNDDIGVTNAIVISVTDGSLSAALPAFNLSVTNTNDAPTISGTPANSVNEGEAYHFAPEANDVDPETTLTFSIVNKPEWLSFDTSNGGLSGTPTNEDVGATAGIVISVSDGELSASLAAFTLNVVNVNDAPNANDDSYSLPIAADSIYILDVLLNDTDPDEDVLRITAASSSVGQVSIVDNSLRFAPADNFNGQASLEYRISDGELSAMARVEVTISGVNPLAPTITIAQDIDVNASGMFTKVNLGAVSARDAQGNRLAVTLLNGQPLFAPGKHQAYWQATDANGISSTETQVVNVHPLVSLSKSQQVNANSAVTVKVLLNGAAPQYPLDINYSVSGSAMAMTDHDLAGGTVQITSGNSADIQFNVFADLASEQSKDIVITLDESLNLGTNASTRITVSNANIAPEVKLQAAQNGVISSQLSKTAGPVTVSGVVSDVNASDALSLTWHAETLINTATDPAQFVFDPAALAAGVYKLTLTATDSGSPALSTTRTINLLLVNSLPVLGDGDSNGNLIPDAEEGYGDRDGNGIPDYQDPGLSCNALPEQLQQVSSYLAEAEPGVCMLKGATSLLTNTGGIELGSDIVPLLEPDMQATNTGGIFDFELSQLPQAGDSIRIVIPQRQPVPAGGIYRKYTTAAGWANFVTNANNSLFSASGNAGYCPPPGDASWQAGLTEGHWCVQLLIEDGGPNDADGIANNNIADPGGVAVPFSNNAIPLATADTYNLQWNQSHELNVLSNDSDADNDSLQITQVSANFGQVSISDDMTQLIYTPETDFIGSDTLVYGISDGKGGTSSAQVAIVVYFNRAPQVVATATASTNDRTAINIDVLSSASDPDGDSLSILVATAEQGMISISEGMLRYVPKAGFDGTDRVSFVISDGRGGIAQGEVLVSVQAYEVITVVNKSSGGSTGVWGLMLLSLLLLRRLKLNAAVRFTRFTKGAAAMLMVLLSSVLLVSTPTAQAKGLTFDGYIGQSTASKSASDIAAGLPAEARLLDYDNSATSFALGGSYSLTDKLALQAHYVDLGETSFSIEADTLSAEQLHQQISAVDSLLAKGIRSGFSYKVLQVEGWSMAVQGGVF
ncbi:Ig-like domain-containing protein, partial [Arsukibacterium sp. UBA3189]|uniref:Ig-like domain-containing protein n=5 Tax=unclassified Arsukibacterium TaxID=2635278 RepID=UPI0025C22B1A